MNERAANPHSFATPDGVVHEGERAIRRDGASDWPWANCGKRLYNAVWIDKPVNCILCLTGQVEGPYD